jgi:hypothetical protein
MLIIIIGLPGSGKTSYIKNNKLFKDFIIHDDFISNFFNGELINDLKENNKDICIADPRLCNVEIFNKFIIIIQELIKDKSNIKLLLFENNKNKCLINAKLRNNKNKKVDKNIELLSEIYNLDNYKHLNYSYEVLSVY